MRFLVVDDEPLVRRSLVRAIQMRGHQATEAVDGTEGLEKWLNEKPDVVFVDVLMPGMGGPDVVRRAREHESQAQVVLMSAYSGEDSESLAKECGAQHFVAKPFEDIFAIVALGEDLALAKR